MLQFDVRLWRMRYHGERCNCSWRNQFGLKYLYNALYGLGHVRGVAVMVGSVFANRARLCLLLAAVSPVWMMAASVAAEEPVVPESHGGLDLQRFTFQSLDRLYYLHVPERLRSRADNALVLVFHGGRGSGADIARQTNLVGYADRYGFIAAFPNAADSAWNDGRSTTESSTDDVGFIVALAEHVSKSYRVDHRRVFVTGASNGGMFTLRLACDTSDRFAAFASVIANLPASYVSRCRPQSARPVLMINGTDDRLMKWHGGTIPSVPGIGRGGEVISTERTVQFWVTNNGCKASPSDEELSDQADDGTRVVRHTYAECTSGEEVILYEVRGGGHGWPGGPSRKGALAARLSGKVSQNVSASEVIVEFFRRHGL
jgi:polyhydroxybutyrate depolymerase